MQNGSSDPTKSTNLVSHDEMQNSPLEETGSTLPENTSQNSPVTTSQSSTNMQLPLHVLAPSSGLQASLDNGNQSGQNLDVPGTMESVVTQQSQAVLLFPDSLSVSQPQSGQDSGEKNKIQNELLQEQIKLYKEKQSQLAQLQSQIESLLKGKVSGTSVGGNPAVFNNETSLTVNTTSHLMNNPEVSNLEYKRQTRSKDLTPKPESTLLTDIDLDLNSNNTVKSTEDRVAGCPSTPPVVAQQQSPTQGTPQPTITPLILRNSSVHDFQEKNSGETEFKSGFNSQNEHVEVKKDQVLPPLWTPLALKSVAKQQRHSNTQETKSEPKESDFIQKNGSTASPDRQVLSETNQQIEKTEKENIQEICGLKTPPSCKKRSAFKKVCGTGLTPVVGSLSLRANSDKKFSYHEDVGSKSLLKSQVLRMANERYLEALLDNEVELYTCRLTVDHSPTDNRCYNPVAKTLLEGDDLVSTNAI